MKIKIKNADELKKLLDSLALDIVDANIYYILYSNLNDSINDNTREFSQSNTFWSLTFDSLQDALMFRLCRAFDQESKSLNLFNLLMTIKTNVHFFEENHFRERLKDNAFVESLAEDDHIPIESQLDKDIWFASDQNYLVKKLMIWRNNIFAHKGTKASLGENKILVDNPLSEQELKTLLDESFSIVNRYSSLYQASTWSRKIVGQDDYKSLLKFIKLGLQKWDEDNAKELQEIKRKQAQQDNPSDGL